MVSCIFWKLLYIQQNILNKLHVLHYTFQTLNITKSVEDLFKKWFNLLIHALLSIPVNEGAHTVGHVDRPEYRGIIHAFRSIQKSSGFSGLYQGVKPNVLGSASAWGFYFML